MPLLVQMESYSILAMTQSDLSSTEQIKEKASLYAFCQVRLNPTPCPAYSRIESAIRAVRRIYNHADHNWKYAGYCRTRKHAVPPRNFYGLGQLMNWVSLSIESCRDFYNYSREPKFSEIVRSNIAMIFADLERAREALKYDWSEGNYYQYICIEEIREGIAYHRPKNRHREFHKWEQSKQSYFTDSGKNIKDAYAKYSIIFSLSLI